MKRTRRNHGAEFKTKVAVAALRSDKILTELAKHFGVHPTQITDWKQKFFFDWLVIPTVSLC